MEKVFYSSSVEDTEKVGEWLGNQLDKNAVVALFGSMGAGKTALVRGVARSLECRNSVSSPTFAIVHEYNGKNTVYHFDMYRVTTWEDLESTGFFDYLGNNGIIVIEWSENIENALPADAIRVTIEKCSSEDERKITLVGEVILNDDTCG